MPIKIQNEDDKEVEVYTAEEVEAAKVEAAAAKDAEFAPIKTELEGKLTAAEKAATERAGEFAHFRKLSDEQVSALTEKDRIIYQNGLALKDSEDKRIAAEEATKKAAVDTLIASKAGGNPKLIEKMKEMWPLIGVEATTPEQLDAKAQMVLGALSTSVPDLVATAAGFGGGSYQPPTPPKKDGESYADTAAGKAAAAEIGLVIEAPKPN